MGWEICETQYLIHPKLEVSESFAYEHDAEVFTVDVCPRIGTEIEKNDGLEKKLAGKSIHFRWLLPQ